MILKINLKKDNLTQMTCKHINSRIQGPKSGFYIMRMNQWEVSDKLGVTSILRVFEDTTGPQRFCKFLASLKYFSRKKSHRVSRAAIGEI